MLVETLTQMLCRSWPELYKKVEDAVGKLDSQWSKILMEMGYESSKQMEELTLVLRVDTPVDVRACPVFTLASKAAVDTYPAVFLI